MKSVKIKSILVRIFRPMQDVSTTFIRRVYSVRRETPEITADANQSSIHKYKITQKVVSFCVDNSNTNFCVDNSNTNCGAALP
jgi:hypothetical protein